MTPAHPLTRAYWRPILKHLIQEAIKVFDEFCICTLCRQERGYEAARKRQGAKK